MAVPSGHPRRDGPRTRPAFLAQACRTGSVRWLRRDADRREARNPEKALFDFAYLSAGRSRLFTSLPELTLPRGFRRSELKNWVAKTPSERSRTSTQRKLDPFIAAAAR
jgi:hypothetical protein